MVALVSAPHTGNRFTSVMVRTNSLVTCANPSLTATTIRLVDGP